MRDFGGCDLAGLKVCFVAGTLGQGGAERQLYYMLRELVAQGARPRVLCLSRGEYWEARIRELGVPVAWVGRSASRLQRLWGIVGELRSDPPDMLQSQHLHTNLYVVAAARMLGIPEVGALRSDGIHDVVSIGRVLGTLSLRLPRLVAANSRAGIANAVASGMSAERLRFLPNVVDTRRFAARAASHDPVVHLLAVGRLGPEKRFDRLLRVLGRVRERAALRATIVGDGPLRPELEALAATLGLGADCLTFAGAATDMAAHYQAADLLVLTSDWEGTPNVVLEAMASGLPVVATRVGGMADIVTNGSAGLLLDAADEEGLAAAITTLGTDVDARRAYGSRARAFVEQHHAVDLLGGELRHLYAAAALARVGPARREAM